MIEHQVSYDDSNKRIKKWHDMANTRWAIDELHTHSGPCLKRGEQQSNQDEFDSDEQDSGFSDCCSQDTELVD